MKNRTGCAPVAAGLAVLTAAALTLTGCGATTADADGDGEVCLPPLACGPMYPVAYYPYTYNPYFGYLTPMGPYVHISVYGSHYTHVSYTPRAAPVTPGWGTARPLYVPKPNVAPPNYKAPVAKPAAPAPAKPAAPAAPKVSTPKVATSRK